MSVFGGDSWGREAHQRKRRVDDLIVDGLNNNRDSDSYKKLSNGKYACLVCPNNPIFDSSLMLSMHKKGSRHVTAESRLKERELMRQEEMKKRIALSDGSVGTATSHISNQQFELKGKPLIEWTRKAASEALSNHRPEKNSPNKHHNLKSNKKSTSFFSPSSSSHSEQRTESTLNVKSEPLDSNENSRGCATEAAGKILAEQQSEFVERRERELKFTAAGWKRDCHGRWFRDTNVEFDSDEEDPNVCLP